ncbi:DUF565 domain-containing protein [Prochlorococcus sp. MIT 1223]|uniref:DUF565 domain-containing protein n=1 Tax=Prochlorococcus sp. MIT 1223 TaxID=3096217 RepID=UPI0039C3A762
MSIQKTRINLFVKSLSSAFLYSAKGPWKSRSVGILSILFGYYFSSNLLTYLIDSKTQKVIVLILLLIFLEVIVRLRTRILKIYSFSVYFYLLDNFRLGTTYSIVLEAFKLGS